MTAIETQPEAGGLDLDLRYYLSVFRRRFWWFFAVWTVVAFLGVGYAYILPPVYEARASILVQSQQISPDLIRSTVTAPVSERIAVIRQRLLTRETLLDLAEKHGIFPRGSTASPTVQADVMRRAIRFEQIALDTSQPWVPNPSGATAFNIAFTAGDGETAAAVVNDLVTRILQQNARLRRDRAETTAEFFAQEVERLGEELSRIEAEIIRFMAENEAALPDSLDYRRDQLDLLQERAQGLELRRLELEQERSSLGFILQSVESPTQSEAERALEAARRQLVERSALLSPQHPEIRGLRSRVEAYEAVVAAERAAKAQAAASGADAPPSPAAIEARRRLGFIDTQVEYIGQRLEEIEVQREALERSILATPNVEIALNALQRTYEEIEERHQTARSKLGEARAGEQLEDKQQGERFEVIEQATVPEWPIKPSRTKIALAGVAGGFAAGVGLILLLEMLSGVVRRPADLERIRRPPVAELPYVFTPNERRRLWAGRVALMLVVFGGGAAALWAIHVHYMPLETLAEKILAKTPFGGIAEMIRQRFG